MSWREILGVADTADNSRSHDLHKCSVQPKSKNELDVTENPKPVAKLSLNEESRIHAWLAYIEETDPVIINEYLSMCRNDLKHREYFLMRSKEVPKSGSNL
ncbi:MAG: hypothetical protein OXC41_03605 [Gammaproteobacteria bacterium]|nr:hypothetical protein [Gammaproteobacteria bacterium]